IRGTNVMECVVWSFRLSTGTSTGTASVDFASIISIGALPRAATSDGCLEPLFLSVMAALFDLRQAKKKSAAKRLRSSWDSPFGPATRGAWGEGGGRTLSQNAISRMVPSRN